MQGRGLKPRMSQFVVSPSGSPLMQGRGLKLLPAEETRTPYPVAPHAGAWIETRDLSAIKLRAEHVAPHAGAWIETCYQKQEGNRGDVAPHAGAWIETSAGIVNKLRDARRPSCRGVD